MALAEDTAAFVSGSVPLWKSRLKISRTGGVIGNLENIAIALRGDSLWAGAFAEDKFKQQVSLMRQSPWENNCTTPVAWHENDTLHLTEWLQQQGVPAARINTEDAVKMVASENSFHPVREYFNGLVWDGRARISSWLTYFLGADDTPFNQAVGARWLVSAVARVMRPGCKADCMLILEGPQGSYKSSVFRSLAEPWFTDEIADLGSKDAAQQLRGVWIIELAELDVMSRAESARIKAWVSRSTDRYRPSYGHTVIDFPRQCIFAGTCNRSDYLRDDTGGRRFWPVRIGTIDIHALRAERDQLWAEALTRFNSGDKWWLHETDLIADAVEIQEARRTPDAWEDLIIEWLSDRPNLQETTSAHIMGDCLGLPKDRWTRADQMRVASALSIAGWRHARVTRNGKRLWVFRRLA